MQPNKSYQTFNIKYFARETFFPNTFNELFGTVIIISSSSSFQFHRGTLEKLQQSMVCRIIDESNSCFLYANSNLFEEFLIFINITMFQNFSQCLNIQRLKYFT